MDPQQHATEAADLHEWEIFLQLAPPHVRPDVAADALTAYSGIPDQQHRGPRESHRQVTCPGHRPPEAPTAERTQMHVSASLREPPNQLTGGSRSARRVVPSSCIAGRLTHPREGS